MFVPHCPLPNCNILEEASTQHHCAVVDLLNFPKPSNVIGGCAILGYAFL